MSPWLIGGVVAYWLVAFWVAHRIGDFLFRSQRQPVPPSRPRTRLLLDRERTGVVHVLPSVGDAENARKWGHG